MKNTYLDYGHSDKMGPRLRAVVQHQLIDDLTYYGIQDKALSFDWTNSCIEGHEEQYLDGTVENFSGIKVLNRQNIVVAEGWMEFLYDSSENFFIAYWEYLNILVSGREIQVKADGGIPEHIFAKIPLTLRNKL